ncbi:carbohydrate kinase [Arsenicitalea aurantiaca]|uniref:Carbohydrate kinase n=1 Tax=Arsenicitalea aurantiaca TaxID=1783274 RepID=A0A433XBG4_9HYPH|nr:FGGY-family carbohydrate kinase [Arsenicitalea aurantiaca]RUT31416.1 carbohydrate kinase [Arsenicitalea aurantiaca]
MTQRDIVIGLDIGTTSTIGLAARMPESVLGVASRPTTLTSRHAGWAEEDPAQWWDNAVSILRELTQTIDPEAIAGICVTGMLPAVVLLDDADRVLRPSIQQSDGRCGREVEDLRAELDEDAFLARTGNGINQQLVAAKLRWIGRHEPDVFSKIATVFGSYDYINFRLAGRKTAEQNWALEAGFTDLATGAIADDLVALAGIPRSAVPPRAVSHAVMGHVSAEAAEATGLREGIPVFGGAADHIVSALGAGIVSAGDVLLKFGGAGDIVVATDKALPDHRLYLDYHLVPGLFAPNGCMAASGSALNWATTLLVPDAGSPGAPKPHVALDRLAAAVPAGSDGLFCLPYFLGEKTPIHDPLARGAFVGLSLSHGQGHLWRALLEAVAYGFRHHVEVLGEIGHAPRRFYASDGGTNSRLWMQIMADMLGEPVQLLNNHHGSSLGAAFVAAIGAGLVSDWSAVGALSPRGDIVKPDAANAAIYAEGYARYRDLYLRLAPWFHAGAR